MTATALTPPWVAKLVLAYRDYERAKVALANAQDAMCAAEARLHEINLEQQHWKSKQMGLAAAALRANGEDGV